MKRLLLTLIILLSSVNISAQSLKGVAPAYDTVYRTGRIGDAYHFLLLKENGQYFHLYTNKTKEISATDLQSPELLKILKKKQSWGKAFSKNGLYTINNGKLYTKLLWNPIKILSPKKIKYLNKVFYLK